MKKHLLTYMAFLSFMGYANAQAPDTWQAGQNVAKELGMGDLDVFSGAMTANDNGDYDVTSLGDYWKGDVPNEYSNSKGPSIISFYNKGLVNLYQVVKFPAGSYTIDVQALYREGTPLDNFQNHFNKKTFKYGHLYAEAINIQGTDTTVTRTFDRVLCTLATANQHESLFFDSDGSWKNDYEYKRNEKEEGATEDNWISYFCPQCLPGLGEYFLKDKYHNTMKIVLTEDTYMRIGFRKTGSVAQDWMPFTNFQVIYEGPADAAAQMEQAREEVKDVLSSLEELQFSLDSKGFGGLAAIIGDEIMDSEAKSDEATELQTLIDLLDNLNKKLDSFNASVEVVESLNDLLNMSSDMLSSTDFEGKPAFQAAYDEGLACAGEDDIDKLGDDPAAFYRKAYEALATARANYLNTAPANDKGAKDFTSLIKNPWFVNAEYTPRAIDGGWSLNNEWDVWEGGADYKDRVSGRTDICSKVQISSDVNVTNQWYKFVNYTSGWSPGIRLYNQCRLICASTTWNSGLVGSEEVRQQLVGLPNGYYALNALVKGWDACGTWNTNPKMLGCFAENSQEVRVSSITSENTGKWWDWGDPTSWDDVQTSIISINDGKLLIGAGTSIAGSFTGFRLSYYGENPDFNDMIQKKLDYVKELAANNAFLAGDQKIVKDYLAEVAMPITDPDAYEAALAPIKKAQTYMDEVIKANKNYTAEKTYNDLQGNFIDDETASDIIGTALAHALAVTGTDDATYTIYESLTADANAYSSYMTLYKKAKAFNDTNVENLINKQTAELKATYTEAQKMQSYIGNLNSVYTIAAMKALGAEDASEANPTNVTSFIVNPSFTDSPSDGWSGETPTVNEYGRGNAELWNKSAFTLSQKLTHLPAGTYELRAKAIYRDGTRVTEELVKAYNEAGNEEAWANHNAQLFAKTSDDNDQSAYIKAIESLKGTENTFTYVATAFDSEEISDDETLTFATKFEKIAGTTIPDDEIKYVMDGGITEKEDGAYPFDTHVDVDGTTYFFPSSMQGFYQWCTKNPEAVSNKVRITINNGDVLEIGIRKTAAISEDWVIFDDFELYYLSGDEFKKVETGVEDINAATADDNAPAYNVAGQQVTDSYKGIVIKNGKKVLK